MTYEIAGIKAGLGPGEQVPLRREIDDWWFSKDENDLNQRSLFVLALQRFMDMTPNPGNPHDLSYFSIAGSPHLYHFSKLFIGLTKLKQGSMGDLFFLGIPPRRRSKITARIGKQHFQPGIDHTYFSTNRGSMKSCIN